MRVDPSLPRGGSRLLRSLRALGLVLGCGLVLAGAVQAQDGRGMADLSEVVEVQLVSIDVLATDKKGRAIDDLERRQLVLFDNNRKTPITHFSRDEPGMVESERLTVVVFLDSLHLRVANRDASLPALRSFLRQVLDRPQANAMLVVFDGRLHMVQDLTSDYGAIARGLSTIETMEETRSEGRDLQRLAQATVVETLELLTGQGEQVAAGRASLKGAFGQLRLYAKAVHEDAIASVDALASLVDSLALVPGRKAIIYLGDGIAIRPLDHVLEEMDQRIYGSAQYRQQDLMRGPDYGEHLRDSDERSTGSRQMDNSVFRQQTAPQPFDDFGLRRFTTAVSKYETFPRFRALAARANTNRVTFYPLKPAPAEAALATLGDRATDTQALHRLSDVTSSFDYLAEATGGRSMVTGNDVAGFLEQAIADMGSFYSIGFAPESFVEGSFHRLELRTKRRGVQLRYRRSYFAKSLRERVVERTAGALLLGWSENNHDVELTRVSQSPALGGFFKIELRALVPLGKLALVPNGGVLSDQVRVVMSVMTEDREQLEPRYIVMPLRIPVADWERAQEQFYSVSMSFDLPVGNHLVAVGIWDENAGTGSFLRKSLTVRPQVEPSAGPEAAEGVGAPAS